MVGEGWARDVDTSTSAIQMPQAPHILLDIGCNLMIISHMIPIHDFNSQVAMLRASAFESTPIFIFDAILSVDACSLKNVHNTCVRVRATEPGLTLVTTLLNQHERPSHFH